MSSPCLCWPPCSPCSWRCSGTGRTTGSAGLSWGPLVYIGTISYGMYLYHMFCQFLTWEVLTPGMASWPRWPKFGLRLVVFFALTVGVSTLSYRILEKPFLRLKAFLR